jgi:hypothetical protein
VSVPIVLEAPTVSTHGALPGAVMAPHLQLAGGILPHVAAAATDGDALVGQLLGRQSQRVGPVRLVDVGADRHVDDADVVGLGVGGDPAKRRDDVADRAWPFLSSTFSDTSEAPGAMPSSHRRNRARCRR